MILTKFDEIKYGDIIEVSEENGKIVFRGVALFLQDKIWMSDENFLLRPGSDGVFKFADLDRGIPKYYKKDGSVNESELPSADSSPISTIGLVGLTDFEKTDRKVEKLNSLYEVSETVKKIAL